MTKLTYTFAALLFCLVIQSRADDQILPPLITTSGYGEVKVEPDEADVSISVQLRDTSVQQLRTQLDNTTSNIIAYLKDQGIAAKDIKTNYMTVYPYYSQSETNSGNTNPDYYVGQKSMTFLLKNLSDYDNIMSGLYDLGLNQVDGINFKVANEDPSKIEAKRRAVANAQDIATAMAEELGVELGNVYYVSDSSYGGPQPLPIFANAAVAMDSAGSGSAGPSVAGGEVTFSSNVNVAFYIIQ